MLGTHHSETRWVRLDRFWASLTAGRRASWPSQVLAVVGGALMVVSSVIHLHLWMTGYEEISTIGPLFLTQVIVGFALALTVAFARRTWSSLLGVGFVVATLAGFLISVNVGLFGFQDSWSAPFAVTAFVVEAASAVALLGHAGLLMLGSANERGGPSPPPPES